MLKADFKDIVVVKAVIRLIRVICCSKALNNELHEQHEC
jgi:hypothetical protein